MRRYETVLCKLHNTSGIEIFSKAQEAANMEILGSWCYTRGSRAVSILSEETSIPGGVARGSIPGRLAASTQSGVPSVPGKIPGGMTSCPTPVGQQAGVVSLISFVYTRSDRHFCLYQVKSTFCLYQGVEYPYSHQRPWGGERLAGRYTPVERLRRCLRDCRWEGRRPGDDTCCGRLVSPISNTVGGWAQRSKAAASGRAASITTFVYTRSDRRFCLYQVKSTFCLYQGVVYPYSHQRPWGSERLGGRYTPVE